MFLLGESFCISLYPDDPIGRTTKSHEEIPSVVSQVISTLINIILSCLCPPREFGPVNFSGADLLSGKSSERKNINRSEALLISTHTHSLMHSAWRERETYLLEGGTHVFGSCLLSFIHLIQRKFLLGFLPHEGFPG